ncbi:MAG TPA: GH92 family glycosyl hydrolase [Opitutaceae bacterium]|jgi:predicted alpha-1,2-mannosidase
MKLPCFLVPLFTGFALAGAAPSLSPIDSVDVFIGTSNSRWMMFPGATLPFGLVKLSPDNQGNVWNGGYEYTVGSISGFSHLHGFGLSGLSVMPVTGPMEYNPGLYRIFPGSPDGPFGNMWTSGYRSRFLKETEHASPGYYAVDLFDWRVKTEVSATDRCGALRFTFPETPEAHLVLDFGFPTEELTKVIDVTVRQTGPAEIEGCIHQHNQYAGEYRVYFVLQTDQPLRSMDAWQRGPFAGKSSNYGTDWQTPVDYRRGVRALSGHDQCGVALNFETHAGEIVQVRTGISLTGVEGARRNLAAEMGPMGWDFDEVVRNARSAWNRRLASVEVAGGSEAERRMFYTSLYRAFSAKSALQDVDGGYVDFTGRHRRIDRPGAAVYSGDSMWGCEWTLFPLWTLLAPSTASSWTNFLVDAAKTWGWIPQAPVMAGYAPVMTAQHQESLIVSSYQKGIRDFDVAAAYAAIRHDLTTPGVPMPNGGFAGDRNLDSYLAHGYVPEDAGPSSNTFEYAYDDWVAGQFAAALGRTDDAREFERRSESWRNQIDPATGYARRRRADGRWSEDSDPFKFGTTGGWSGPGFEEGTPWVYTFFVPQNPRGLVALLGEGRFNRRLQAGFEQGQVDLTNEENLQAPFLFDYSGQPWLTQKYVRSSLAKFWSPTPLVGWVGEEDEGQLSALYVQWAMGLFEMDGGCSIRPGYDLTSPLFDRVVLHLDPHYYGGKDFVIEARHNGPNSPYIQSARLNGRPLTAPRISHEAIVAGGTLELELGPAANPKWGSGQ